jgi:hypothetical protein
MKILIIIGLLLAALITTLVHGQPIYSDITYDAGTSIEIQSGADVCATNIIINGVFSGGGTICTGPLPVTLSSFTFTVTKNNVLLRWVTESEINNSGFKVERISGNGSIWHEIGFVNGHGTTNEPKTYLFEDKKLQTGFYTYRIKQTDYNGNYEYFELGQQVAISKPNLFSVSQNYPNPSNPKSKIDYEIPESGIVTIRLYNLLGQEVYKILNEPKEAGYYTVEFDGTSLASGVYFYRIEAGKFTAIKKMVLLK